jgi:16S rRNA (uracil1498-N3)-methyltransferase
LRKRPGDLIDAVDGQGNEFSVVLESILPESVTGRIIRHRRQSREPVSRITLAQAITKGLKMDLIVQKATELGVVRFLPMLTEHAVVSPDEMSALNKQQRWQKMAISAMKQSLRSYLPRVESLARYEDVLQEVAQVDLALMASFAKEAQPCRQVVSAGQISRKVLLLVGPEGGFSAEEAQKAQQAGVQMVSLGPRRLRSETAAIVMVGLVLFQLGEME